MSIFHNYFTIHDNTFYYTHNYEILLVKCSSDISIELINPKYISFFDKNENNNKNMYFKNYSLQEKNYSYVQSIEIILHEYNILYIPRFWLFKIEHIHNNLEFFSTHNIFTKIYSYNN